ncbi:MAG: hypothetical protein IJJ30_05465 [Erysipelotrichaceae bacterium]|nr:hypothetical protein [Erysipelotrichaceae bacterium]MBR2551387.1 hypothetical protein [Erysipelotrichaceae bacterium]
MGVGRKIVIGTALLAGAAAVASSMYARKVAETKEPGHRYVTKAEAAEILGRPFAEPTKMLEGVVKKGYRLYEDPTIIEIVYKEKETDQGLVLRISDTVSAEDLNNDYHLYEIEQDLDYNGLGMRVFGDEGSVSDVLFVKDGLQYALLSELPMSFAAAKAIIASFE